MPSTTRKFAGPVTPGLAGRSQGQGPLCNLDALEIVHADLAEAKALRDLHILTWETTYRDRALKSWYGEQLAAHAVRDWGEIVRSQAAQAARY